MKEKRVNDDVVCYEYMMDELSPQEKKEFLVGRNAVFQSRSSMYVPYEEKTLAGLFTDVYSVLVIKNQDHRILGGLTTHIDGHNILRIKNVWVSVDNQKKGYAKVMLRSVQEFHKDMHGFSLNVASTYPPAIKLYEKTGYKRVALQDHTPNTYFYIEMTKKVQFQWKYEVNRIIRYWYSSIKFHFLFDEHSNPSVINKLIHGQ